MTARMNFNIQGNRTTYDFIVEDEEIVCFFGRRNYLSNFFSAPIIIDSCLYPTVEHYYQRRKLFYFGGLEWSSKLNDINDPSEVKSKVKNLISSIDQRSIDLWKRNQGLAVFELALHHKFTQHPNLARNLLDTGDRLLVHSNNFEHLWGSASNAATVKKWAKCNKGKVLNIPRNIKSETINSFPLIASGRNILGFLLMQTRDRLVSKNFIPVENKVWPTKSKLKNNRENRADISSEIDLAI